MCFKIVLEKTIIAPFAGSPRRIMPWAQNCMELYPAREKQTLSLKGQVEYSVFSLLQKPCCHLTVNVGGIEATRGFHNEMWGDAWWRLPFEIEF